MAEAKLEGYLKHPLLERAGHWIHLLNVTILILTGFQIHSPSWNLFGSLNTARFLHFIFMYLFCAVGAFHTYHWLVSGEWRDEFPTAESFRTIGPWLRYYLFLTDEKPQVIKYNPLQKFTYLGMFVISVVQGVLGFALYWPDLFAAVVNLAGGLTYVRAYHYLVNWIFIYFLMLHLYLVFSEGLRLLKAMITGYEAPAEEA
ncbi:MAG: cytochrome b/b6 domain-containing protein [Anaerolineae bacterium]